MIAELLTNPRAFEARRRGYELLARFLDPQSRGIPVEALRPLFQSSDPFILRTGAFIAAELGHRAGVLLDDVLPLLQCADRHTVWYAMDVIVVCSIGTRADRLLHLALMISCPDQTLRLQAMNLMTRATGAQISAARLAAERSSQSAHVRGLGGLVDPAPIDVAAMIGSDDPTLRRYAAIAAHRLRDRSLLGQLRTSDDEDLRTFLEDLIALKVSWTDDFGPAN